MPAAALPETPDLVIRGAAVHGLLQPVLARAAPVPHRRGRHPRSAAPWPKASRPHRSDPASVLASRRRSARGRRPMNTPHCGVNCSGAIRSASSATCTRLRSSGASTRLRRCSTRALASGLVKGRCGRVKLIVSLAAFLSGLVLGLEPHRDRRPGPGMVGQSTAIGLGAFSSWLGGERQRELRAGTSERPLLLSRLLDDAFDGGDAVIVLALVAQGEGAARIHLGRPGKAISGSRSGMASMVSVDAVGKAVPHRELARAVELVALLAHLGALVGLGRQRRETLARRDLRVPSPGDTDTTVEWIGARRFWPRARSIMSGGMRV